MNWKPGSNRLVCICLNANTLEKGVHPTIFPPAIGI